jgi:HEAT repeat protein
VAALGRLVQAGDVARVPALEELARPGGTSAPAARLALAFAGDRRIQAWLEQSLQAPSAFEREQAATGLAALGVPARAAPLLADPDGSVRARAACTLLMAARSSRR